MAGSVGEVPAPLFFADRDWAPSGMVTRVRRNKSWIVFCNGGDQSAFFPRHDGDDFTQYLLDSLFKFDPSPSSPSGRSLVLRIRGGPLIMVRKLATDFLSQA